MSEDAINLEGTSNSRFMMLSESEGFRCRVSIQLLATEAGSLIEKETVSYKHGLRLKK